MISYALKPVVGLVALCAVIFGADAKAQEAPSDWQGAYGGGLAGFVWTHAGIGAPTGNSSENFEGFTGGILGGFNFLLSDDILAGLEADLTYNDAGDVVSLRLHKGSLVGRIGVLLDPSFLMYALGGLTGAKFEAEVEFENSVMMLIFDGETETLIPITTTTTQQGNVSRKLWGYVVGGGIEKQFDNLGFLSRLGLEYRFSDYDQWKFNVLGQSFSVDPQTHELRLRFIVALN